MHGLNLEIFIDVFETGQKPHSDTVVNKSPEAHPWTTDLERVDPKLMSYKNKLCSCIFKATINISLMPESRIGEALSSK